MTCEKFIHDLPFIFFKSELCPIHQRLNEQELRKHAAKKTMEVGIFPDFSRFRERKGNNRDIRQSQANLLLGVFLKVPTLFVENRYYISCVAGSVDFAGDFLGRESFSWKTHLRHRNNGGILAVGKVGLD